MRVYHYPPRELIVEESDPQFLQDNQITTFAPPRGAAPALPPSFSIKQIMTDARNQGQSGSCTHFGCVSAFEPLFGKTTDLSEAHLQHGSEKQFGDCVPGAAIAHCMTYLRDSGIVEERFWGYDDSQCCWKTPPNIAGQPLYRFSRIEVAFQRPSGAVIAMMQRQVEQNVIDIASVLEPMPANFVGIIKAVLANVKVPVVIDVPVWWKSDGHLQANWESGPDIIMPVPANVRTFLEQSAPPNVSGWHAIAICGFDDSTGRFEFKNSWNWWWGNNGFGTLPYDYITAYSRIGMFGTL